MTKPRVLHVITVYNGKQFVLDAIESALRFDDALVETDVLILDDASPAPGWSETVKAFCIGKGAHYYRTPRNLGIPRNVSLGLLIAMKEGYNYVTINNSDVIFPRNLMTVMVEGCRQANVGSVTAWSNNVSIYTLPNDNPDAYLSNQSTVDFLSETLAAAMPADPLDIPAGISFCIMMPVDAVRTVGVMDPIFGRGYCEESDWSLRSLKAGLRLCLAPRSFVYHQGRGSNLSAGIVSAHHTTVPENENIIDERYPEFRAQVAAFEARGDMVRLKKQAIAAFIDAAAARAGYSIEAGWAHRKPDHASDRVEAEVLPNGHGPAIAYRFRGFEEIIAFDGDDFVATIEKRFGKPPVSNALGFRSPAGARLTRAGFGDAGPGVVGSGAAGSRTFAMNARS